MSFHNLVFRLKTEDLRCISEGCGVGADALVSILATPWRLRELGVNGLKVVCLHLDSRPALRRDIVRQAPEGPLYAFHVGEWARYVRAVLYGGLYSLRTGERRTDVDARQEAAVLADATTRLRALLSSLRSSPHSTNSTQLQTTHSHAFKSADHTRNTSVPQAPPPPASSPPCIHASSTASLNHVSVASTTCVSLKHPFRRSYDSTRSSAPSKQSSVSEPQIHSLIQDKINAEYLYKDHLGTWFHSLITGTYNCIPPPCSYNVLLTADMMDTVLDTSEAGEWRCREGVSLVWYFAAQGSGLVSGECSMGITGAQQSFVNIGHVYQTREHIDATAALNTLSPAIRAQIVASTGVPSLRGVGLQFRVHFTTRSKALRIATALLVQARTSPARQLCKVYESTLGADAERGAAVAGETIRMWRNPLTFCEDPLLLRDRIVREHMHALEEAGVQKMRERGREELNEWEYGDLVLSFACPVSMGRMVHPGKGRRCKHRTFDVQTYLLSGSGKCPDCKKTIPQSELVIDAQVLHLLMKYPNVSKCILHADGHDAPFDEDARGSTDTIDLDAPRPLDSAEMCDVTYVPDEEEDRVLRRNAIAAARRVRRKLEEEARLAATVENPDTIVIDD